MANKEVVTVLTVKTEQSQNTIKGLKAEIADLKKTLDNAVIGSDEFEQASRNLATAQANLKTVLADGKKTTDAVEGSYNHLVATMAELKKEWKATADEVKRNDLGQQIDAINTKLKDMDASTGNFQRNVGDYANQFKEAFDEQQKATQNTRLGLEGLQKTAAGLASGYAAVQGVMNLLNIENSNFEKAMIKVQSAMAVAQGIGGMKDLIEGAGTLKVMFGGAITGVKGFIKGLSGVKAAIAGTGIGLLVVALGAVVANWDKIVGVMDKFINKSSGAAEAIKKIADAQKQLTDETAYYNKEREKANEIALAGGASQKEILEGDLKAIQETYNKQSKIVSDAWKQYNALTILGGIKKKDIEEAKKVYDEAVELASQYGKEVNAVKHKIRVEDAKIAKQTRDAEEAANKERIAAAEAEKEKRIAAAQAEKEEAQNIAEEARIAQIDTKEEELAELKRIYEQEKKLLEDHKLDTANLTKQYEREQEEISNKYAEEDLKNLEKNIDKTADIERRKLDKQQQVREQWLADNTVEADGNGDGWNTQEELDNYQAFLNTKQAMYAEAIGAENLLIESQISKLQELADAQAAAGMDNTGTLESIENLRIQLEENNAAILQNEKDTLKAKEKANKEYEESEKKRKKLVAEYSLNIASNTLGSLASILGEESAAGKAAAVAQATIDTYAAANSAYKAMAGIPVVGPALGAAAAAAAVIAGVANVKKILSVDKDGSGANVSASAAATPNVNLAESMPIQYTRELLTDSETTNLNKEQRVYVLESDISNTQENVKVKESNSSF